MADFETGDIVRLGAALLVDSSDTVVNTFHVKINSGGPMAFAAASVEFQEYIELLYRPLVTKYVTVVVGDRISVKNETQNTVWGAIAWSPSFTGSSGSQVTSYQVALLGWGRTPISRVQIRKYWGPFTEADCSSGLWNSALRAVVGGVMDDHITEQTTTGGLVLQGVAYNKTLDRATVALTATTAEVPVIQRRRRRGRGA